MTNGFTLSTAKDHALVIHQDGQSFTGTIISADKNPADHYQLPDGRFEVSCSAPAPREFIYN